MSRSRTGVVATFAAKGWFLVLFLCVVASTAGCTNVEGTQEPGARNGDIAFAKEDGALALMHPDGTGLRELPVGHDIEAIAWSPDGTKLLFCCWHGQIAILNVDGSGLEAIADPASTPVNELSWSPDAKMIAVLSGGPVLVVMRADGTSQTRYSSLRSTPQYVWSPSGSVAQVQSDGTLVLMAADGQDRHEVNTDGLLNVTSVSWSPDGARLALEACTAHGECAFYLTDATGTEVRPIHPEGLPAAPFSLEWSPDGDWILVNSADGIYVMHPDGFGLKLLVSGFVGGSWSPDGKYVLLRRLLNPEAMEEPGARYNFAIQVVGTDGRHLTTIAQTTCSAYCARAAWQPMP